MHGHSTKKVLQTRTLQVEPEVFSDSTWMHARPQHRTGASNADELSRLQDCQDLRSRYPRLLRELRRFLSIEVADLFFLSVTGFAEGIIQLLEGVARSENRVEGKNASQEAGNLTLALRRPVPVLTQNQGTFKV